MTEVSTATDETGSKENVVATNNTSRRDSPRPGFGGGRPGLPNAIDALTSPALTGSGDHQDGNDYNDQDKRSPNPQPGAPLLPVKSRTAPLPGEYAESSENAAIDPLSHHILKRTQTEKSIPYRLRTQTSYGADSSADGSKPSPTEQISNRAESFPLSAKAPKEKKKGVSFLSRIIGTKKNQPTVDLNESNASGSQAEGANGKDDIFAHPIGFIPRFPPPPKYIKVKAHFKKHKAFDRVFLAQELDSVNDGSGHNGEQDEGKSNSKAIWAMVFSKDGKYLATAGQDKIVRVWAVITNAEDREAHEQEESEVRGDEGLRLTAPVFKAKPFREYHGHTGSVLDLSWSKNNFLLSSSMDRTVRLWHVSRAECLCCFKHSDFVTSIQFHPRDDRFFLAGSLDSKLRLWSIPDKSVAFFATVRDMITSVAFTPDGKYSIAGCLNGLCILYETDGLKANAQVHVRSARGRNAKGSKITGIDTIVYPPNDPKGDIKLLVTSNDSRIRLYNFKDRSLEAKYRGNENSSSQIRASFSDDGKYIICGSEDRHTYIWPTAGVEKEGKRALEELETRTDIVTCAIMAPTSTKQLLGLSGDPLYDLCNPPPITLVSQVDSPRSSKQSDELHNKDHRNGGKDKDSTPTATKMKGSPTYFARSTHPDGNIILAADYSGRIKVFRQDCAYNKRPNDWDATSTFSKKLLGRSNSARHSIASSIGRESKTPSERILAWRSSVSGTELASINSPSNGSRVRTPSPRKSGLRLRSRYSSPVGSPPAKTESGYVTPRTHSAVDDESETGDHRNAEATKIADGSDSASESGSGSGLGSESEGDGKENGNSHYEDEKPLPEIVPRFVESGQSNAFWTKSAEFVRNIRSGRLLHPSDATTMRHYHHGQDYDDDDKGSSSGDAMRRRKSSAVSALSSDIASGYSSSVGSHRPDTSDKMDSKPASTNEGDVMRCSQCRGINFRATKIKGRQKLVCVKCNTVAQ